MRSSLDSGHWFGFICWIQFAATACGDVTEEGLFCAAAGAAIRNDPTTPVTKHLLNICDLRMWDMPVKETQTQRQGSNRGTTMGKPSRAAGHDRNARHLSEQGPRNNGGQSGALAAKACRHVVARSFKLTH